MIDAAMVACCHFNSSEGYFPQSCSANKLPALIALVVGVGLVGISVTLASGLYGGATMYFVAAAVVVSSLIPFSVAACKLTEKRDSKAE